MGDLDDATDGESLSTLLNAAARAVVEAWVKDLAVLGLGLASVAVLEALISSGRTTPAALARSMRVGAESLGPVLGDLVSRGYVLRIRRTSGWISATVVITGSGVRVVEAARRHERAVLAGLVRNPSLLRKELEAIVVTLA